VLAFYKLPDEDGAVKTHSAHFWACSRPMTPPG
jgi:hypothetical protein